MGEKETEVQPPEKSMGGICGGCGACMTDAYGVCKGCDSSACKKSTCTCSSGLTEAVAARHGPLAARQLASMPPDQRAAAGICKACGYCIVDAYDDCKGCGAGCTPKDCICQNQVD